MDSVGEYYHAGAAASAAPTKQTERVFPQNTRNTQNILAEKYLPHIGTDAHRLGGYGIPAIPTPPITQPNHLRKSVKSVGEYYHAHKQANGERVPTEYAEHTEHSGRESLPQIDTDAHRLGGYGIPAIPTPPITQPNILWIPWENTTTLINKQTGRECPTEYTEHTENSGREVPPTDCTDVHRLGATNAT